MNRVFRRMLLLAVSGSALFGQDVSGIYAAHCANCHGADGGGNTVLGRALKLRDLGSPDVNKLSDAELAAIISRGADRGRMPAFEKKLGAEAVSQLASYVRNIDARPAERQVKASNTQGIAAPPDAKATYATYCAHCHGFDGSGNTILGRRMALGDMRSHAVRQYPDSQLAAVIANGMDRGRMPGFQKKLGTPVVQQLASYVRVLMGGSPLTATDRTLVQRADTPSGPGPSQVPTPATQGQHLALQGADSSAGVTGPNSVASAQPSRIAEVSLAIVLRAKRASATEVVDLNSASMERLMTLPGITEADASSIIAGRPYKSALQFKTRNIIDAGKYAQIADKILAKQAGRGSKSSADERR